jgi:hypothetical protein
MTVCDSCGSTSIGKATERPTDKVIALLTGRRLFLCRRCGWRGRRRWTDADLEKLREYGVGGAEPDPSLAVLDDQLQIRGRTAQQTTKPANERSADFDLADVPFTRTDIIVQAPESLEAPGHIPWVERRSVRRRLRQSRRKEVLGTIALTVGTMLFIVVMGLMGNCTFVRSIGF